MSYDMQVEEAPTPPRPDAHRARTRSETPTCLYYGNLRHFYFPDAFFCQHCTTLEAAKGSKTAGRIKDDGRRFRCEANHTNWMYPDDKRKYMQNQMYSGTRDGDDSDDGVDNNEDAVIEDCHHLKMQQRGFIPYGV
jgi:hypothetical protein